MICKNCGEPILKDMGEWAHIVSKGSYGYQERYIFCRTSTKAEPISKPKGNLRPIIEKYSINYKHNKVKHAD